MAMKCLHGLNLPYRTLASPQLFLLPLGPKTTHTYNNPCFLRYRSVNFATDLCRKNMVRSSQSCDGSGFDCRDYHNEEICEHFDRSPVNYHQNIESDVHIQFFQEAGEIQNNNDDGSVGYYSYMSCWVSSKLELFDPSFFRMKLDPAPEYWPEDEGTERSAEFALEVQRRRRATNNVAIRTTLHPSLKMVKAKNNLSTANNNYWQVAGDFSYCSVRKVFSVTVFMIRELLSYMLRIRESLYSEDLRKVMDRVQIEINYTFVWLFESVFASTPTLMVSVMLLLANFTAHSMAGTAAIAAACIPRISTTSTCYDDEEEDIGGGEEMMITSQEKELWATMLKQATKFELEDVHEGSQLGDCVRTSNYMLYHTTIDESPRYSLLLLNSALFLNPNPQVLDRAEECYKRAIMMEPWDAELRILYADFLWLVKKDLTSAEESYQEAVEVEPNYYHTFKYATFLLETGSSDICFPLYDLGTNIR